MSIHWCCLVHHIKHPWILQSSQQFDVLWPSISMCLLDSPLHKLTLHYTHLLILPSAYPMTLHSQLADPDPPKTRAPLCKHQCNTFAASIMLVFLIHTNLLPSLSCKPNKLTNNRNKALLQKRIISSLKRVQNPWNFVTWLTMIIKYPCVVLFLYAGTTTFPLHASTSRTSMCRTSLSSPAGACNDQASRVAHWG